MLASTVIAILAFTGAASAAPVKVRSSLHLLLPPLWC